MIDVLVVDDEIAIAKLIMFVLESNGYDVRIAADGEAAIDAIKERKPDLIVLDLMLPTISGFDVLQNIRQEMGITNLPVIVLTCRGQKEDRDRAIKLGATEYLTKPFSPTSLVNTLKTYAGAASE
ncbi:MAG: response regulator [Caldiserica bacterium]|nr:response regulator [Caldisericota bacterium]